MIGRQKYAFFVYKYYSFHSFSLEEFQDTKRVIRICKFKKDKQCNWQKKKSKRTNNDLQNLSISVIYPFLWHVNLKNEITLHTLCFCNISLSVASQFKE
jgi:hypothetical protein